MEILHVHIFVFLVLVCLLNVVSSVSESGSRGAVICMIRADRTYDLFPLNPTSSSTKYIIAYMMVMSTSLY